ncbi:MAG: hypothetical protein LKI21_00290 [Bifidobacterium crudilactis]|jgi:DNA-binding XRE family transcriptional regulator|nr:hypothetical protein [Bifidobacterium crudilactis]
MTLTQTQLRAKALGISAVTMKAVESMDDQPLDYWMALKAECEKHNEDFEEILWALYYPGNPEGLHN